MKIFKFSAMILLLILVFGSCKKDMDSISPDIKKNFDTDNFVNSRSSKSDLPEFMAKRLLEYDQVTQSLGLQSFKARWGAVKTGTRIYSTNSKNDNLIIFPIEGDLGQRNLLVGAYNEKAIGVFVISENAILTEENIKGTPFDVDFQRIFDSSSDGVLAGMDDITLPDGCYEWTGGDCFCFLNIPCPGGPGGSDPDDPIDPIDPVDPDDPIDPIDPDDPGGFSGGLHGGHGGGGVGVVHITNYAYKFKAQILSLKNKYNLGPKMTQWLFDHAAIFLDDELAADIEEKIATIVALQKELGFDDDVAVYLLDNAPDGADEKDLIILALSYILGPNVTVTDGSPSTDATVINDLSNFWGLDLTHNDIPFEVSILNTGKLKSVADFPLDFGLDFRISFITQKESLPNTPYKLSHSAFFLGTSSSSWLENEYDDVANPSNNGYQQVHISGVISRTVTIVLPLIEYNLVTNYSVDIDGFISRVHGHGLLNMK